MANETEIRFKTTFLLRRGLAEAWTRVNPTLMYGEPGFEKDTYKLKIGDGVTAWNDLAYFGGDYSISADGKSIVLSQSTLALYGFADATTGQIPSKGSDGKIVWVNQSTSTQNNAYNYIKQIGDYLFEVQYSTENIDYDYANTYFKSRPANESGGGCTGIYKDGKVLRHLDWYYNDNAEFIVRRPADELNSIHGSIGVCASVNELTKEVVESGDYNIKFQLVPFIMTDGINDAGLYIQSNVVPSLDGGFDLNPTASEECCISMALRYMLDHCASFAEVETFFNTVHIYSTSAVGNYGYHFLLAKGNEWEVIEITSNGHITVTEGTGTNQMPHGIMTNFRTTGLSFTNDNVNWSSVETYGGGVERYDIATKAFTDERSFALLQNDLLYTHMYTGATPEWLTELCGETDETYGKLTVMDAVNNPEKFTTLMAKEAAAYAARDRKATDPDTWQTTHSAIYDLATKSFKISIQERLDDSFEFFLNEEDKISGKQDQIIAGTNVTIGSDGKTINATDTKYTVTLDI